MTVRELRPDEWREARELRLQALADTPTAFLRTLAEEQGLEDEVWRDRAAPSERHASFVCEADGKLLGTATGVIDPDDGETYLVAMWVAPSHRRRGLGIELVERVCEWAASRGAGRVTLEVNERLEPAIRLYSRAGFRPTGGRRPLPTDPGHDALELRRELPR